MSSTPFIRLLHKYPVFGSWLLLLAVLNFSPISRANEADNNQFRVGFSHTLFSDVNENDAKAAVKAWGQSIAKERGIPTAPEPQIFRNTPEVLQALKNKAVDAVAISAIEYAAVNGEVPLAPIFVTYNTGRTREQYLLLVHRNSKLENIRDLQGKTLVFHQAARDCLAPPWLDTQLLQAGAKPYAEWLGNVSFSPKISQAVLPVFFHKSDACVVTRTAFETMCELNPQLGQQLKIVATSPEVVATIFCFRADYAPVFKEKLLAGLRNLHKTPSGLQVLTIFQSEKIEDQPAVCMASALELLALQAHLAGEKPTTNTQPLVKTSQPVIGSNP